MRIDLPKKWDEKEKNVEKRIQPGRNGTSPEEPTLEDYPNYPDLVELIKQTKKSKRMNITQNEKALICTSIEEAIDKKAYNLMDMSALNPIIDTATSIYYLSNDSRTSLACDRVKNYLTAFKQIFRPENQYFLDEIPTRHMVWIKDSLEKYLKELDKNFYEGNYTGIVTSTDEFTGLLIAILPVDFVYQTLYDLGETMQRFL